jgi:ferredoxin-NADP reductase
VTQPAVFLAGGIGITPFRSMLLDATRGRHPPITLFFSNDHEREAAFLGELQRLERALSDFRLVATMTEQPGWPGEQGRINGPMLRRTVGELKGPVYYVAGPPKMVRDLRRKLVDAEVPKKSIRVEEFTGY